MAFTVVSRVSANPASAPYASPAQPHAAGNTLVMQAIHGDIATVLTGVTNTAGDTWLKTAASPFFDGVGHYHESWYVPATKGAPADVVACAFSGGNSTNDFSIVVYELNVGVFPLAYTGVDGTGASGADVNNFIFTPTLAVAVPSIIVASLRNSNDNTPVTYSLTQFYNTGGELTKYDGYQLASAPQAVTAHIPGQPFAQWSILAAVFTQGSRAPVPGGCPQDLPAAAASGGGGCATDLGTVTLPGGA